MTAPASNNLLDDVDDVDDDGPYVPLADVLAARVPGPRVRWAPTRMYDVPEDEDGECFFCHGCPGPAGCGECGARG